MKKEKSDHAKKSLKGPIVPLTTPIREDDSVDYDGLVKLVNFYIENGIKTFIAVGTTGYCYALRPDEHEKAVKTTVQTAAGRAYTIAGVSHSGTAMANDLADRCEKVGADALLMVPPYYHQTRSFEGCFQHYKVVSENHSLPMIIYNMPYSNFKVDFFRKCAEVENILCVKEASGNYNFARDLLIELGNRYIVLGGGSMQYYLWLWMWGSPAYVTSIANLVPQVETQFYHHLEENNLPAATRVVADLENPFIRLMTEYGWHESLHAALKLFGLPATKLRLPLVEPPPEHIKKIKNELVKLGLLKEKQ